MAVEVTEVRKDFVGTGAPADYSPGIYAQGAEQISVTVDGIFTTDYTLSGLGNENGFTVHGTFANGATVTIARHVPKTQDVNTQNQSVILEDVFDAALDKAVMIDQELGHDIERTIRVPDGETGFVFGAAATRANKYLRFDATGTVLLLQSAVEIAAALASTLVTLLGSGFKGDPGSPGEGYSTRVSMALAGDSASNLDDAYLTEAHRSGKFVFYSAAGFLAATGGDLATQVALDPQQGVYVPKQSDPTGAGGAWVRQAEALTPAMFGAVPYNPDAEVWCHDEINAFFRFARSFFEAGRFVFDGKGDWGVAGKIYAAYWEGVEPNIDRRFTGITLRVAPLADLPGGVPLDVALEIAGYHMNWSGVIGVHPSGAAQTGILYADRRYEVGVRRRFCNASTFGAIYVDCAKYDGVWDASEGSPFVLDGINFPHANNIGMSTGLVYARFCGSQNSAYPGNAAPSQVITLKEQGYADNDFVNTFDGSNVFTGVNNGFQRTRLTVASTENIRLLDSVWTRLELTPAIYGTIAADSATRTITWSAGDPTNIDGAGHGLEVGDVYPLFQGGPNATGIEFRIVSFGGTSNRTITVDKAPASHAATADPAYQQLGRPTWHTVAKIEATKLLVFPWVPLRNNSPLYISSGQALRVSGENSANTKYAGLVGFGCSGAYFGTALYAPSFDTMLLEACDFGMRLGHPNGAPHSGLEVTHGHAEANLSDVVVQSSLLLARLAFRSYLDFAKWTHTAARASINQQVQGRSLAPFGSIEAYDYHSGLVVRSFTGLTCYDPTPFEVTTAGIDNSPRLREAYIHTTNPTIDVSVDWDIARIFPRHHWARIIWTDDDGEYPTGGTLTLHLNAALIALGWAFAGAGTGDTYAVAAPATMVRLELQYLFTAKRIAITRIDGV